MARKIKIMSSVAGYNLAADYYDEKEKYLNSFEKNQLLPLLGDVAGKKILDVGAGTGRLSLQLFKAGAEVTALDVSEKMLQKIKNQKIVLSEVEGSKIYPERSRGIKIIIGDAENLPFENENFDIVVAAFLVVHLKDPRIFFDEVYCVLKDGGIFLLTNINQKEPPLVKTAKGEIKIESFYHRPEKIKKILNALTFNIKKEIFIKEGDVWVNQIVVAGK